MSATGFGSGGGCGLGRKGRHIPTPTVMDAHDLASKGRKVTTDENYRGVSLSFLVEKQPDKFWPTPRAQEPGCTSEGYGRALAELVEGREQKKRMWPTPVSSDGNGGLSPERFYSYDRERQMKRLSYLRDAVLYPTPGTTGLSNGSGNCGKANRLKDEGIISEEERRSFRAGNGGKLNPDWVSWLMGWPVGWDDIMPMEVESFEKWKEKTKVGLWWSQDPAETGDIPRTTDRTENRKKRLMALGNGQVPLCAYAAQEILRGIWNRIEEE